MTTPQTINRDRLEQYISNPLEHGLTRCEVMELAREMLTLINQKPVGEFYEADPGNWYQRSPGDKAPKWTKLYAYPVASETTPDEQHQHLSQLYHTQEKRLFKLAQLLKGPSFDKYAYSTSQAIDVLESVIFGEQYNAESGAISDGALVNEDTKNKRENGDGESIAWDMQVALATRIDNWESQS